MKRLRGGVYMAVAYTSPPILARSSSTARQTRTADGLRILLHLLGTLGDIRHWLPDLKLWVPHERSMIQLFLSNALAVSATVDANDVQVFR